MDEPIAPGPDPEDGIFPPITEPPIIPGPLFPFSLPVLGDFIGATGGPLAEEIEEVGEEVAVPD